jgi:flagellin-like protein
MRKLRMSRKALSPVVAAIILIAVTVAVSIAVAAWMGALTFSFTKTEELKITGITASNSTHVTLSVSNTGASQLGVTGAKVDDVTANCYRGDTGALISTSAIYTLDKGATGTVIIRKPSGTFTVSVKYNLALTTQSGNLYTYQWTGL